MTLNNAGAVESTGKNSADPTLQLKVLRKVKFSSWKSIAVKRDKHKVGPNAKSVC